MKKTLVGLAALATALALAPSAGAATITGITPTDENAAGGGCSLREAVDAAVADTTLDTVAANGCTRVTDADPTVDTIVLTGATPFNLTAAAGGDIAVGGGGPIVIRSDDPAVRRTIHMPDDTGENRVFLLNDAAADLTLRNLTITNADDVLSGNGGVLYGQAAGSKLTVENSEVNATKSGRNARNGGVIAVSFGSSLTVRDSVITGGEVSQFGGGIYSNGTPVTIERSRIHTNMTDATFSGYAGGGGIYLDLNGNATLTMTDSEVYDNDVGATTACPGPNPCELDGGGIYAGNNATIKRSLISGNSVTSTGDSFEYAGGIYVNTTSGALDVSNSTFQGNIAGAPVGAKQGRGGAIVDYSTTTTLIHDTFAGNDAATAGQGDDLAESGPGGITYSGSIFSGSDDPCDPGTMISGGYNAMSSADCASVATDNVGGATGLAGALADNGGTVVGGTGGAPIRTLAISNAGTAFNLVPVGAICDAAEGTDQRGAGFTRPAAGACDAGAFEVQPQATVTPPPAATPGPTGQRAAALKKCKKKKSAKARKKCKQKAKRLPV